METLPGSQTQLKFVGRKDRIGEMSALVLVYLGESGCSSIVIAHWSDPWSTSKAVLGCSKAEWLPESPTHGLMLGVQYEVSLNLEQLGTEPEIPTHHYKAHDEGKREVRGGQSKVFLKYHFFLIGKIMNTHTEFFNVRKVQRKSKAAAAPPSR